MKKILTAFALFALTGGGALMADKLLKGDQFTIAGVNFPQPFQTTSGQILKAGVYDLKVVSDGTVGVLIGLFKEGKQVGQLRGTVMQGGTPYCGGCGDHQQGSGSPGKALPVDQGVKLQPGGAIGPIENKVQPAGIVTPSDNKAFRDLGLSPASAVSFGGGSGKISNNNHLHPGGANLPYIAFAFLPPTQRK